MTIEEAVMGNTKLKTVVFAGAGSSKAVSSDSFPTTIEFFERLPDSITNNKIFQHTVSYAKQQLKKGNQIDIEHVLWNLGELKKAIKNVSNSKHIFGDFLLGNKLANATGITANLGNFKDVISRGAAAVNELEDQINAQVYELYGYEPSKAELQDNWLLLINSLFSANQYVDFFTTNYDLVIESAIDEFNKIDNSNITIEEGWRGNRKKSLDIDIWRNTNSANGKDGLLTKLHGSIDWKWREKEVIQSDIMYAGNHKRHSILYPGFKGIPTNPIFQSFHGHLARALRSADHIIFIGFAFRDEYINDICERSIREECPVFVIDPSEEINKEPLPLDCRHIKAGFDKNSVMHVINDLVRSKQA